MCAHSSVICRLIYVDGSSSRLDECKTCHTPLKCNHFRLQKVIIPYGKTRTSRPIDTILPVEEIELLDNLG